MTIGHSLAGSGEEPPGVGDLLLQLLDVLVQHGDLCVELLTFSRERGHLRLHLLYIPVHLALFVAAQGQLKGRL
jgi:hypothetical protein